MTTLLQLAAPSLARAVDPNLGVRANEDALLAYAASVDDELFESIARDVARLTSPGDLPVAGWMWVLDMFTSFVSQPLLVDLAVSWHGATLKFRALDAMRSQATKPGPFVEVVERTLSTSRMEDDDFAPEPAIDRRDSAALLFALLQLDHTVTGPALARLMNDDRAQPAREAFDAWLKGLSAETQAHWLERVRGDDLFA